MFNTRKLVLVTKFSHNSAENGASGFNRYQTENKLHTRTLAYSNGIIHRKIWRTPRRKFHAIFFFFVCQIKISVVKQMLSARLALIVHLPDAVTILEEFINSV